MFNQDPKGRNSLHSFCCRGGVIAGMVIGDGLPLRGRKGCHDAHLHVEQKDAEFVQLLWNLFNSIGIVGAAPSTRSRTDKRTNNTYTTTQFATFTHPFSFLLIFFNSGIIM
jgi:hypothetical protein